MTITALAFEEPDEPGRRRARRGAQADMRLFAADVDAALRAFTADVSYAVQMARSAVTITRKRAVWQARKDTKLAETAAHLECEAAEPFACAAVSPCGTGDCKYANGEMTMLHIPTQRGGTERPQRSNSDQYTIEAAVHPLLDLRRSQR